MLPSAHSRFSLRLAASIQALGLIALSLSLLQTAQSATPTTTAVLAWGANSEGQLGDGTFIDQPLPANITQSGALKGKTVVQIGTGLADSFALCSDGTLAAWGYNLYGQLGQGTVSSSQNLPKLISGNGALKGKKVTQIAVGYTHNLVLCSDGTLAAWGENSYGQLGDGTAQNRNLPVAISNRGDLNGKTITRLAVGSIQSVALCSDGTVVAWGDAGFQGADPDSHPTTPTAFNNKGALSGKPVTLIATGASHTLALCSDGTLVAWGFNDQGQLGNGNTSQMGLPVTVTKGNVLKGKTITGLAAGFKSSYALCSDGTLAAWGDNSGGQLGDGSMANRLLPVAITGKGALRGKTVVQLAAGANHALALCSDGTVAAWGRGTAGQLGDGSAMNQPLPVSITAQGALKGKKVARLAGGFNHTLALATIAPDSHLPIVVITSPISGQSLPLSAFNNNTIRGTASDDTGIEKVQLRLYRTRGGGVQTWNGTQFTPLTPTVTVPATLSASPIATTDVNWTMGTRSPPPGQLDLGPYYVWAYATDAAGNTTAARNSFTLIAPDTTKPAVTITSPTANQTISLAQFNGSTLSGTATDNSNVASLQLKLYRTRNGALEVWNGTAFTTDATPTVLATFNGTTWTMGNKAPTPGQLDAGVYSLIAYATDSSGNNASARVSFSLSAGAAISTPASSAAGS